MDRRAWILMWLLALVWGASYLFIKVGLDDFHPVFLVFGRLLLAALVLVPLAMRAGALDRIAEHWRPVLFLAVVQVVVPFLLIAFGQQHVPSAMTGILIASAPIFTVLLAWGSPTERVGGTHLAGVLVGLVGVALLFGVDLTGNADTLIGGGMILVASLGYAIGALHLRRRLGHLPSLGVAAGSMAVSAAILVPGAVLTLPGAAPSLEGAASLLALGLLGTGVAFGIFYELIARVGAAKSSVVAYIAPGFALLYGALLLDEAVTLGSAGGLALILAGSWVAAEGRVPGRRREPAAAPATA